MREPIELTWAYGVSAITHSVVNLSDTKSDRVLFASSNTAVVQVRLLLKNEVTKSPWPELYGYGACGPSQHWPLACASHFVGQMSCTTKLVETRGWVEA